MGVAARLEGDGVACGYMGVVVADVVAVGMAFSLADAGGDAGVRANGYANAAAGVAVGAAIAVAVLRSQQGDLVVGHQGGILACRDVAALDEDIAVFACTGGDEVDVAASLYATAMAACAALIAVALAFAGADRDGDRGGLGGAPSASPLAASCSSPVEFHRSTPSLPQAGPSTGVRATAVHPLRPLS